MYKITEVKPLEDYQVWIKFSDGVEGTVDLSDLAEKGVFSVWKDKEVFNSVVVDPESHTLVWKGGLDLCPDTLYANILGVDPLSLLRKKAAA